MKNPARKVVALAAIAVCVAPSRGADVLEESDSGWQFDAGADFRIRQEIMDNLPGLPGDAYSMTPSLRAAYRNQIRMRPRVWVELENGPFRLYSRLADEFRLFPTLHTPRRKRAYYFPDEVFLDNLYLEARGLEVEPLWSLGISSVDFRIGRQDMFERGHSIFGLDRIIAEGTPFDGSRSFYSDMVRATLHWQEDKKLDAFALYDFGRSDIRWGTAGSRGRSLNVNNMSDTNDLDEWGGGLIYSQDALEGRLPFKAYAIYKHTTSHMTMRPAPRERPAKEITLLGLWAEPRILDDVSLELEGGRQFGRFLGINRRAGGYMGHAELKYHSAFLKELKPIVSAAVTYYSGDRHSTDEGAGDESWDPMWGRYTQDSEMLVYGTLYENCWWSNMIYAKAKLTMNFGPHHAMYVYTGPMFAAVQDDLGTRDGSGSTYKGLLSAARYDFPVRLAPKGASGLDRFEVFGHVIGEMFQPGDYFDSSKPCYFIRWQFEFRF